MKDTFSSIIKNGIPALDNNGACEQVENIQIRIQVLEHAKPRHCSNFIKVQLEFCYISQVSLV